MVRAGCSSEVALSSASVEYGTSLNTKITWHELGNEQVHILNNKYLCFSKSKLHFHKSCDYQEVKHLNKC